MVLLKLEHGFRESLISFTAGEHFNLEGDVIQ